MLLLLGVLVLVFVNGVFDISCVSEVIVNGVFDISYGFYNYSL